MLNCQPGAGILNDIATTVKHSILWAIKTYSNSIVFSVGLHYTWSVLSGKPTKWGTTSSPTCHIQCSFCTSHTLCFIDGRLSVNKLPWPPIILVVWKRYSWINVDQKCDNSKDVNTLFPTILSVTQEYFIGVVQWDIQSNLVIPTPR